MLPNDPATPSACKVPAYAAHAAQNGSDAFSPGTPVGSGAAVNGTVWIVRPGRPAGGVDVVGAVDGCRDVQAEARSTPNTTHRNCLNATRRS